MNFERAELHDFRLYRHLTIEFAPGVNVLTGPNAAGKTSVLEALGVLATGRSFRGASDPEMVRTGEDGYRLAARFAGRGGSHTVGVVFVRGGDRGGDANPTRKVSSLDGHPLTRSADILGRIPLLSFSPDDLALVKGGPSERRRFLDVLLSQTSPTYRDHLARYQKGLAQRNALLADLGARRLAPEAARVWLEPWDQALGGEARAIQTARAEIVERVAPLAARVFAGIDGRDLSLSYLADVFDPDRSADELRRGVTLSGPHRDEVVLAVAGQDARRFASQGQQRSVVLALKLAALDLMEERTGEKPVLLLDDVMSELDPKRGAALLPHLLRGQTFVTTTDRADLERAVAAGGLSPAVEAWFEVSGDGSVVRRDRA